jgi:hypothetical protein
MEFVHGLELKSEWICGNHKLMTDYEMNPFIFLSTSVYGQSNRKLDRSTVITIPFSTIFGRGSIIANELGKKFMKFLINKKIQLKKLRTKRIGMISLVSSRPKEMPNKMSMDLKIMGLIGKRLISSKKMSKFDSALSIVLMRI